jgi:predicted nucleic acid-binding protein
VSPPSLQNVAWKAASLLGWPDTFDAEYVALTQLHADALITLDRQLAQAVQDLVTVAPIESLVWRSVGEGEDEVEL